MKVRVGYRSSYNRSSYNRASRREVFYIRTRKLETFIFFLSVGNSRPYNIPVVAMVIILALICFMA